MSSSIGPGAELAPGSVFAGDFRIVRPLAAGGMGAVYVAEQISTARQRALKIMLGELASNEDLKRRFEQEAKVGARIESEHIVEVVGAGIEPRWGAPWLAMELLQGQDLASFLEERGALPMAVAHEIFQQLAHAMSAAHRQHVVHRDLKPENIFLAQARRAGSSFVLKVLDFGIAKLVDQARTGVTGAMGTPLWMAPEQTQTSTNITAAADVWAVGLIAFKALTGRSFWKSAGDANASSMMVLREVAFEHIPSASERARELGAAPLPPGFDAWFSRCVVREPGARFQDASAMWAELEPILGAPESRGSQVPSATAASAPLPSSLRAPESAVPARRSPWLALVLAGVSAVAVGAYALTRGEGNKPKRVLAEDEDEARPTATTTSSEAVAPVATATASAFDPARPPSDSTMTGASAETADSSASASTSSSALAPGSGAAIAGGVEAATGGRAAATGTPKGNASLGGAAVSGASVPNAGAVTAGMASGFRRCYARGLAENPNMKGSVRIIAKIGPSGEVLSATPSGGGGLSGTVTGCVAARVASARFAPPEGGSTATVVIPVTFTPR